jgi:hypothetical protein
MEPEGTLFHKPLLWFGVDEGGRAIDPESRTHLQPITKRT